MAETGNTVITEFSAFGPWVYEISETYPLPKLFAPYFKEDDQAIMKVKIPRKIDRRDAEPDMELYDYVIAMYEDRLRILERQNDKVTERNITSEGFVGILLFNNLLQGACSILSKESTTTFSYNTVSSDIIEKLTGLIFEKLGSGSADAGKVDVSGLPVSHTMPDAMLLATQLHNLSLERNDFTIGAVQKSVDLRRIDDSALNTVESIIWQEMNPEALHIYTDKELIIIQNGSFPNRIGTPDYGYTYARILLSQIDKAEITASSKYMDLMTCKIRLGKTQLTYHYASDDTEMADFYDAINKL